MRFKTFFQKINCMIEIDVLTTKITYKHFLKIRFANWVLCIFQNKFISNLKMFIMIKRRKRKCKEVLLICPKAMDGEGKKNVFYTIISYQLNCFSKIRCLLRLLNNPKGFL